MPFIHDGPTSLKDNEIKALSVFSVAIFSPQAFKSARRVPPLIIHNSSFIIPKCPQGAAFFVIYTLWFVCDLQLVFCNFPRRHRFLNLNLSLSSSRLFQTTPQNITMHIKLFSSLLRLLSSVFSATEGRFF